MLSQKRQGLTRSKLILAIIGGVLALLAIVVAVEFFSFKSLINQGALDTLGQLNFSSRFTSGNKPVSAVVATDVESATAPSVGNAKASLRIVEYVDFSCPYSKEENSVIRELAAVNPDKIYLQVRQFPVDDLHPTARKAAVAASCVGEQGKYWAMHDTLFANQPSDGVWQEADLRGLALAVGSDAAKYDACIKSGKFGGIVTADYSAGAAAGVTGTPTFFINGIKVDGAIPADIWQKIIKLAKI
jgi:protein-disulfide isomerase